MQDRLLLVTAQLGFIIPAQSLARRAVNRWGPAVDILGLITRPDSRTDNRTDARTDARNVQGSVEEYADQDLRGHIGVGLAIVQGRIVR